MTKQVVPEPSVVSDSEAQGNDAYLVIEQAASKASEEVSRAEFVA